MNTEEEGKRRQEKKGLIPGCDVVLSLRLGLEKETGFWILLSK